jgi:hypothetical protein
MSSVKADTVPNAPGEHEDQSMDPERLSANLPLVRVTGVVGGHGSVARVRRFCALTQRDLDRRQRHRGRFGRDRRSEIRGLPRHCLPQ